MLEQKAILLPSGDQAGVVFNPLYRGKGIRRFVSKEKIKISGLPRT
jgi:hypothetical protein